MQRDCWEQSLSCRSPTAISTRVLCLRIGILWRLNFKILVFSPATKPTSDHCRIVVHGSSRRAQLFAPLWSSRGQGQPKRGPVGGVGGNPCVRRRHQGRAVGGPTEASASLRLPTTHLSGGPKAAGQNGFGDFCRSFRPGTATLVHPCTSAETKVTRRTGDRQGRRKVEQRREQLPDRRPVSLSSP